MKLLGKLGKILLSGVIAVKVFVVKTYAVNVQDYTVCDYGVFEPVEKVSVARNIGITIIVPIVLLIGLIVFLLKSTGSALKKTVVTIGVVLAYILFRIIMKNVF